MVMATPLYAGILGILFLYLSFRVIGARRAHKVSVGDGGERAVMKRMRVQANCAEYAPIGVLLLLLAELQGMPLWLVHVAGITLVTGRILHAVGFGHDPQIVPARVWGMYLTVGMIFVMSVANIAHALF